MDIPVERGEFPIDAVDIHVERGEFPIDAVDIHVERGEFPVDARDITFGDREVSRIPPHPNPLPP